jgi:hypothetical protein
MPRRTHRFILVAAAACLVALGGVSTVQLGQHDDRGVDLVGSSLAPGARAEAHLRETSSGEEIGLDTSGLPAAPVGSYYQGWVKGNHGIVSIGTFHVRHGTGGVVLWSGVKLSDYPKITVTLQTEGAGPVDPGRIVLTGDIRQALR